MRNTTIDKNKLWDLGLINIRELETDQGIMASGRNEVYGCIFGRDSLITSLKLLRVDTKKKKNDFQPLVRKILINLCQLQGQKVNLESGEQPGKCIHEFRPDRYDHLTLLLNPPWYVYEDQVLRNYDSVDATPLFLIAIFRYWQAYNDAEFLAQVLPNVDAAINWMINFGDNNSDGLMDYELYSQKRKYGGLVTQNWTDSAESVFHETGGELIYPMAPVELQAYAYLAYRLWASYFRSSNYQKSADLNQRADKLKELFNKNYPTQDPDGNWYLAWKLDGEGTQFRSVRSNMGHCLWASLNKRDDGKIDAIVEKKYIPAIVNRLMQPDMFEPKAGIRTLSKLSVKFQANSYHNGTIWPHDNSMIAEGFEIHGYQKEAEKIKQALLGAITYFNTPIELFTYDSGQYSDYFSENGQRSCKVQAWSAAAILDFTA